MFRRTLSARIISSVAALMAGLGLPPTAAGHFDGSHRNSPSGSVARYNRYRPHQGKRERLRRRIGGFAGVANLAEDLGITRAEAERRVDEFHIAHR